MDTERHQSDLIHNYVNEASSLTASPLTQLIIDATSNPKLFAFSELLTVPAVARLEGTEHSKYVDLLCLFAYGTWSDYKNNAGSYLELVPEQVLKLKQLTVLSATENHKVLSYDVLKQAVDVASVRELEDFLIDACINVGIVKGKLNPLQSCFEVQDAAARDPKPGQLENMIDKLSGWLSTSDKLLLATQEDRLLLATQEYVKQAEKMSELDMKQGKEYKDTENKIKKERKRTSTTPKRKRQQKP